MLANLDFPTYAFDSVNGTQNYSVGVALTVDGAKTKIVLTFPGNASNIFYDPTTSFEADPSALSQARTSGARGAAASPLLALLALAMASAPMLL
jgi:hypothetical protein